MAGWPEINDLFEQSAGGDEDSAEKTIWLQVAVIHELNVGVDFPIMHILLASRQKRIFISIHQNYYVIYIFIMMS